jgi:hypothetical protein
MMKSRLQKLEELTHKKLKINIEKVVKGLNGTFRPTKIHIHTLNLQNAGVLTPAFWRLILFYKISQS